MLRSKIFRTIGLFSTICILIGGVLQSGISQTIAGASSNTDTWALVIGISDYQHIEDLQFAHIDAREFVNYLQSDAGGALEEKTQIKQLINSDAKTYDIYAGLDWLLEKCQEGDRVIIFFAGHGDVEDKLNQQQGFLLSYDTPEDNYRAGAVRLSELNLYLSTLSKKAQVIFLVDACRSGKGNNEGLQGSQAVNFALSQPIGEEIKLISCATNEYSHESEKWGGGRGIFSLHLLDGLYGLADKNNDGQITLKEIGRYVEDNVPLWADPDQQNPTYFGNKKAVMGRVVPELLATVESNGQNALPEFGDTNTRGPKEKTLDAVDPSLTTLYENFENAVEQKKFLESDDQKEGEEKPAIYHYEQLMASLDLKDIHSSVEREFVTALLNDVQDALKSYLKADMVEMEYRFRSKSQTYDRYPGYLEKAMEILGKDHVLYPSLSAKKLYFEGVLLRFQSDQSGTDKTALNAALEKQKAALKNDPLAAFIHNEIGVIYDRLEKWDEAYPYYKKATKLAPGWAIPYANLGIGAGKKLSLDEKIQSVDSSLLLDPDYYMSYAIGGKLYEQKGNYLKAESYYRKAIPMSEWHYLAHQRLGLLQINTGRYAKADSNLALAERRKIEFNKGNEKYGEPRPAFDPREAATITRNVNMELPPTIAELEERLKQNPKDTVALLQLGEAYLIERNEQQAEKWFKETILYSNRFGDAHLKLGNFLFYQGRYEEAAIHRERLVQIAPDSARYWFDLAELYRKQGLYDKEEQIYLNPDLRTSKRTRDIKLGDLYEHLKWYTKAETIYQPYRSEDFDINLLSRFYNRQMDRFPDNAEFFYKNALLVQELFSQGKMTSWDYEKSIAYIKQDYEKALAIAPRQLAIQLDYAKFKDTHQPSFYTLEEVRMAFEKVLALDPNHPYSQRRLIEIYDDFLEYEKSLSLLENLHATKKLDYASRLKLGAYLAYSSQFDKAKTILQKAAEFQPKDKQPLALLSFNDLNRIALYPDAEAVVSKNLLENAKTKNQQILDWNPNDQDALYNLGVIASLEGNNKKAIQWFEKAVNNGFHYPYVLLYDPRITSSLKEGKTYENLIEKARKE